MPTHMTVRRTIKPKNSTPKFVIRKSTSYAITDNPDGSVKITKKKVRSFHVNKG